MSLASKNLHRFPQHGSLLCVPRISQCMLSLKSYNRRVSETSKVIIASTPSQDTVTAGSQPSMMEALGWKGKWTRIKATAKQYWRGMKCVYANGKATVQLEKRRNLGEKLSASQDLFIRKSRIDLQATYPFIFLVFVLPESIPFIVSIFPNTLPDPCDTEEDRLLRWSKQRDNSYQKFKKSMEMIKDAGGYSEALRLVNPHESMDDSIEKIKPLISTLDIDKLPDEVLSPLSLSIGAGGVGPSIYKRYALRRHLKSIEEVDCILDPHKTVEDLTINQLQQIAAHRGFSLLNCSSVVMHLLLKEWQSARNSINLNSKSAMETTTLLCVTNLLRQIKAREYDSAQNGSRLSSHITTNRLLKSSNSIID